MDITYTGKAIRQQVEKEIDSGEIRSAGVEFRVSQLIQEYKIRKEEEKKTLKMILMKQKIIQMMKQQLMLKLLTLKRM